MSQTLLKMESRYHQAYVPGIINQSQTHRLPPIFEDKESFPSHKEQITNSLPQSSLSDVWWRDPLSSKEVNGNSSLYQLAEISAALSPIPIDPVLAVKSETESDGIETDNSILVVENLPWKSIELDTIDLFDGYKLYVLDANLQSSVQLNDEMS